MVAHHQATIVRHALAAAARIAAGVKQARDQQPRFVLSTHVKPKRFIAVCAAQKHMSTQSKDGTHLRCKVIDQPGVLVAAHCKVCIVGQVNHVGWPDIDGVPQWAV